MTCTKCGQPLEENWLLCPVCGRRTVNYRSTKKRGNGQGRVIKQPNGKYKAVATVGYYMDGDKLKRRTVTKTFTKRSDAIAALPTLKSQERATRISFKELYDRWFPTHRAGKSTLDCYRAAMRYFEPLFPVPVADIEIDDLQECIDECPHGKRTRENMKAVVGLMYKYGIPRRLIPSGLNLAEYLIVSGEASAHRDAFTDVQIAKIKKACSTIPHADAILIMIYTGFRPSEFLALQQTDVDLVNGFIIGGAKTEAGRQRIVTISPVIFDAVASLRRESGYLYPRGESTVAWKLRDFSEMVFYPTLEAIGIDNPMVEVAGGKLRHKYTPHTCRHTFATLLKRVTGSDKDKQELIGHASAEMLRYYQDVDLADLKRITDAI